MSKQGSNSELFAHENNALTARSQLHMIGNDFKTSFFCEMGLCLGYFNAEYGLFVCYSVFYAM